MVDRPRIVIALLVVWLTAGWVATRADDRAPALPAPDTSPLFWTQQERIIGFRNFDAISDTRVVDNGTDHLGAEGRPAGLLSPDLRGGRHGLSARPLPRDVRRGGIPGGERRAHPARALSPRAQRDIALGVVLGCEIGDVVAHRRGDPGRLHRQRRRGRSGLPAPPQG